MKNCISTPKFIPMKKEKGKNNELSAYLRYVQFSKEVERVAKGEISDSGLIEDMITENPGIEELLEKLALEETWEDADALLSDAYKERNTAQLIEKLKESGKKKKIVTRRITRISIAASVAIVVGIIGFVIEDRFKGEASGPLIANKYDNYQTPTLILDGTKIIQLEGADKIMTSDYSLQRYDNGEGVAESDGKLGAERRIIVPSGFTSKIVLDDGSEVTLNAGSELVFPAAFGESSREVMLKGEAFFNVTKDPGRPFIVRSPSRASIKVYGTSFNVDTRDDDTFKTLLLEGLVGVKIGNGQEVMLSHSQLMTLNPRTGNYSLEEVHTEDYLGWLQNTFLYIERPIGEVLKDIGIWYGVRIEKPSGKYDHLKVTCSVKRDMELHEMLNFLGKLLNVEFTEEGGSLYRIK